MKIIILHFLCVHIFLSLPNTLADL